MIKFTKWFKIKGKTEQTAGHNDAWPGLFVRKGKGTVFPIITIIQVSMITVTVPPILKLSTIWKWVVNLTPRLLSTQERTLVTSALQAECDPELVRTFWETEKSLTVSGIEPWTESSCYANYATPSLTAWEVCQKYKQLKQYTAQERWTDICKCVGYMWQLWTLGSGSREFFVAEPLITLAQQQKMLPTLQCPVARVTTLEQTTSLWHSNQWCCPLCSAQLPECPLCSAQLPGFPLWHINQWCCPLCSVQLPECPL